MNWKHKIAVWKARILLGGFTGKESYRGEDIYLFSSDGVSGMAESENYMLLNEKLFEEGREEALEMVYTHENLHEKDPSIWNNLLASCQMLYHPLIFPVLALLTIFSLYTAFISETAFLTASLAKNFLLSELVILPLASITSFLGELRIEFKLIEKLGEEKYREACSQIDQMTGSKNIRQTIYSRLTHPMQGTTLKLWEWKEN